MKKQRYWLIGLGVVLVAAVSGWGWRHRQTPSPVSNRQAVSRHSSQRAVRQRRQSTATTQSARRHATPTALLFSKAAVQKTVTTTMGGLSGQTSVAVMPLSGQPAVIWHNQPQRAASVIKLYILATVYQRVAAGKLDLDRHYVLKASDQVGGSGTLQSLPAGTRLTYRDVTERMITVSDNAASNIMIHAVGGLDGVNAEIKSLGLRQTKLNRYLMDTAALKAGHDNVTSVSDVASLLRRLAKHELVSARASRAMLAILKGTANHTKLPHALPAAATVYNKTGEFDTYGVQNDAAIIQNQHGTIIVVVLAEAGQREAQINAMSDLGRALYNQILG